MGRVSRNGLPFRAVSVSILLARVAGRLPARVVRTQAGMVAGVAAVFACSVDTLGAGIVPAHLLLLPRRLLQGVLGGPGVLHRQRAAQVLSGRALVSIDP